MKRIFFICLFVVLCLSGCGIMKSKDDEVAMNEMQTILESIQSRQSDKIKELFVPSVLDIVPDMNQNIIELLNYYSGNYISIKDAGGLTVSENISFGNTINMYSMSYIVTTSEDKYCFAVKWCSSDTTNRDNEGVYAMYVIKYEDNPYKDSTYWGDADEINGIRVNRPFGAIYMDNLIECIQTGDKKKFKSLFANSIVDRQNNLDGQIDILFSLFDGYYDICNRRVKFYKTDSTNGYDISYYIVKENIDSRTAYLLRLRQSVEASIDDVGAISLYFTLLDKEIDTDVPYWGDELWMEGIYIIQDDN